MDRRDRRDRHGRGMRGPLARPPVPLARTRREEFGDLVLDAAERISDYLEDELGTSLTHVAFVVEDVPVLDDQESPDLVPLGRVEHGNAAVPPRVVVYRRPVELRADDGSERAETVHDVVVEMVAELLGLDPDDVDPGFED